MDSSLVPLNRKIILIRNPRICNIECGSCDLTPLLVQSRLDQAQALSATCKRNNAERISYAKKCILKCAEMHIEMQRIKEFTFATAETILNFS